MTKYSQNIKLYERKIVKCDLPLSPCLSYHKKLIKRELNRRRRIPKPAPSYFTKVGDNLCQYYRNRYGGQSVIIYIDNSPEDKVYIVRMPSSRSVYFLRYKKNIRSISQVPIPHLYGDAWIMPTENIELQAIITLMTHFD